MKGKNPIHSSLSSNERVLNAFHITVACAIIAFVVILKGLSIVVGNLLKDCGMLMIFAISDVDLWTSSVGKSQIAFLVCDYYSTCTPWCFVI